MIEKLITSCIRSDERKIHNVSISMGSQYFPMANRHLRLSFTWRNLERHLQADTFGWMQSSQCRGISLLIFGGGTPVVVVVDFLNRMGGAFKQA